MTIIKTLALIAAAAALPAAAVADPRPLVSTYKPMAGFNHVVGGERFVGYFLAGPDRCDVTLFQARADDEALPVAPRRLVLQIAAGGRSELDAGLGAALAIACTADADAIKIAPQTGREAARTAAR
ncbi:MAG: hypothetical protein KGM15_17940 [Pseudomonadota bacterium]|nr:hypothetical protein [Pseudomonadota bacterium]